MSGSFVSQRIGDILRVKFPPEVDYRTSDEIAKAAEEWLETDARLIVFDFEGTTQLHNKAYRPITQLSLQFRKSGRQIVSIHLCEEIAQQIRRAALESVFSPVQTDAVPARGAPPSKPRLDVEFINPFIEATISVMKIQTQTLLTAGKPAVVLTEGFPAGIDIAATLTMTSPVFRGTLALCFSGPVFLSIYSKLVGKKHEQITNATRDAAGEILNMIFGKAKAALNQHQNYQIEKAIPAVLTGNDLRANHLSRQLALLIPFQSEHGELHIEISLS